jgi:hypothetical protein
VLDHRMSVLIVLTVILSWKFPYLSIIHMEAHNANMHEINTYSLYIFNILIHTRDWREETHEFFCVSLEERS